MIRVKCVGHIGASVGRQELELQDEEVETDEIIERLREMVGNPRAAGFNRYNTLVMVEDGEAFIPASKGRKVRNGESVVLIPISHGG